MKNRSKPITRIVRPWLFILSLLLGAQLSARAADILFVTAGAQRDSVKLINILVAQGHNVEICDTNGGCTPPSGAEAQGVYDLLICDEVISSGAIGDRWRNSPVPVVNWEGYLYNGPRSAFNADSGVTGTNYGTAADAAAANGGAGGDYGQVLDETAVNIVDPNHPLAAGLSAGNVDVFDPNAPAVEGEGVGVITFAGARTFIPDVDVVATVPGFDNGYCIFGVEAGVMNADGTTTQARWVHLPWNDSVEGRIMIEPSFFLFEAGVAWALELPEPTKIHDLLPNDGGFLSADSTVVSFSVDKMSNGDSPVDMTGIGLTLNGEDVSGDLSIADGGDQWNVTYDQLESNQVYTLIASATAQDGGTSARMRQIDTFDPNNFTVEAEDFNFDGGMFFDDPTPCVDIGDMVADDNCYFDKVGVQGVDENEPVAGDTDVGTPQGAEVYRFGPGLTREEFTDTYQTSDPLVRQKYTDAQANDSDVRDYQVQNILEGEWLNYTRTIPPIPQDANGYNVYARVASTGTLRIQMDQVTNVDQPVTADEDPQNPEKLGQFVSDGTGGVFSLVPLTDDTGNNKIVVQLEGETSFRMTSLSSGYQVNFYMFVPTSEAQNTPPTVAITSPVDGSEFAEGDEITINADASDDDGTITGVQFYAGTEEPLELLGEDAEAPYSFSFTPPSLGALSTYTIKAVATDDGGLTAEDSVEVDVNDPSIVVVATADGNGADAEIGERAGGQDRGDGDNDSMNTRWTPSEEVLDDQRHDEIVMRFDLSAVSLADISSASLNMISFRGLTGRDIHVYGVNDGAMGGDNNGVTPGYDDNTWEENSVVHSTMPGLLYDDDPTTQDLVLEDLTDLGVLNLALAEGEVWTFSTPELLSFLQNHPDNLVSFLLEQDTDSGGQSRFATKEATALASGTPVVEAGTYAPYLALRVGAPVVALEGIEDGAVVNDGDTVSITVNATAASGKSIANVQFYAGTEEPLTLVGEDAEAPYSFSFTPSGPGDYIIRVVATDNEGTSSQVTLNVTVITPNLLPPAGKLANVIWVSFHEADDTASGGAAGAGFTEAPDRGYTDLLEANGYNVTRYLTTGDPDPAVLNAADLVIIGRSVSSGNYGGASASAWNGITAPIIDMSGYTLRTSRMGYTTGTTMEDTTGDITLDVADPSHPIFDGISLTGNTTDNSFAGVVTYPTDGTTLARGISINNDPANDDGTVLATISSAGNGPAGGLVIGEWQAGAMMTHDAGTDTLAGHRLVFLSGSREADGVSSETAGIFDLSDDGARMFLNAVDYMVHPAPFEVTWVTFHEADDAPTADAAAAGFTEAPDKAYTDLLTANGYDVTRYVTTGTPDPEVLNAADLVIIGRSINSGDYGGDGATAWNGITAPMMIMSGYTLRTSRMGYTTGTTMEDTTGDITLTVNDPSHYIFKGISLTGDTMDNSFAGIATYPTDGTTLARGISINNDPANADGTVLATISSAGNGPVGGMVIGEWQPGSTMAHDGGAGTDALAGARLVFLSGSREADGIDSETAGLYDLAQDGEQMFLNAVRYAASRKGGVAPPSGGEPSFDSIVLQGDGTVTITWTGGGTLQMTPTLSPADWQDVAGAADGQYTASSTDGNAFFRVVQ